MKSSLSRRLPWVLGGLLVLAAAAALLVWQLSPGAPAPQGQGNAKPAAAPPAHGEGAAAAAPAGTATGPRRECVFGESQRLAYDVTTQAETTLDLGGLLGGIGQDQGSVQLQADPPKHVTLEFPWHLDLQAVERRPDGSTVLAARITKGNPEVSGMTLRPDEGGDTTPVFLVRLDQNCAMLEFARKEGVDLRGARSQQALLASLQWQYPKSGAPGRYEVDERDASGNYRARYALVERPDGDLVLRRILRYERLFAAAANDRKPTTLQVGGKGLAVHPGPGPWFESLDSNQNADMQIDKIAVGQMATRTVAKAVVPGATELAVDPKATDWVWGDLFALRFPKTDETPPEVLFSMKGLTFEAALEEYNRLVGDPNAKFLDFANFMRDWIRAHPEGIPAILHAIKNDLFPQEFGESAVFYALGEAETPEARAGLLAVMKDTSYGSINQVRAALALSDGRELPPGYLEDLTRMARGDGSGSPAEKSGVVDMTPILGAVARAQAQANPQVAEAAKAELLGRLGSETEPWRVEAVITGVGNIGGDAPLEAVQPFLGHAEPAVRIAAASALREVSPQKAAALFEPRLSAETDPQVRTAWVHAYWSQAFHAGESPPPAVLQASIAALAGETDPHVVIELIKLLGAAAEQGDATAQAALQARMQTELARPQRNFELLQLLGRFISP